MLLEKIDRLNAHEVALVDTQARHTSFTLVTNNVASDADQAALDAAMATVEASSTTPVTLWRKYSKSEDYTQAVHDLIEPNLIKKMAERRVNSFGAVCDPQDLPKGWKAMVFLPSQQIIRPREAGQRGIRESVPWAGVAENGLLVSGWYVPNAPVMDTQTAFKELAEGIEKSDTTMVTGMEATSHSLDGYANASAWRTASVDATHNTLTRSWPGNLKVELAQNDGKRFRDTPDFEDAAFQDRHDKIAWQTARASAETFKGKELGTLWSCQRALEAALDPTALKLARLSKGPTAEEYNWLMGASKSLLRNRQHLLKNNTASAQDQKVSGSDVLVCDSELATRRQQATSLFPVLARSWYRKIQDYSAEDTLGVIDAGSELVSHLAKKHSVTPRHIKAIRGLHWQRTGNQECTKDTTAFLKTLPLDHMPETKKDWAAWRKSLLFASDLRILENSFGDPYAEAPMNVYTQANSDHAWKDGPVVQTLGTRYTAMDKALGNYTPGGMRDMFAHMRDTLIIPIMKNAAYEDHIKSLSPEDAIRKTDQEIGTGWNARDNANETLTAISGLYSMRQLADATTRWHHNLTAINDHVHDPKLPHMEETWEGVTGPIPLPKGLVARELTSARDLRIQGMIENHCVGGYSDQVLNNTQDTDTTLIYSIENPEKGNKILSTVEVAVHHGEKRSARIVQNYARGNTQASPEALLAGNAVCRHLRKLKDAPFLAHFESVESIKANQAKRTLTLDHEGHRQTVPSGWIKSGYDPRNKASRERAFEAYKTMLPKPLGKSLESLESFVLKEHTKTKNRDPLAFF